MRTGKGSAGGAAVAGGTVYHSRIGGYFLLQCLLDLDITINEDTYPSKIKQISFESSKSVDDLDLVFHDGSTLALQIKRSLSFSGQSDSIFGEVIDQFLDVFIRIPDETHKFALAIPPDSSSTLTRDLKKILKAIQLNDTGFKDNPLNEKERVVLDSFKKITMEIFNQKAGRQMEENELISFWKRCRIYIFDIEPGRPMADAILLTIRNFSNIQPELTWAFIVQKGHEMCSHRLSINLAGLKESLGKYFNQSSQQEDINALGSMPQIEIKNDFPCNKEFILAKDPKDQNDYLLIESIRFDETGTKRWTFFNNNHVRNLAKWELEVVYRTATYKGMERLWDKLKSQTKRNLTILPTHAEETEEIKAAAAKYLEYCKELQKNSQLLRCLHCKKSISTSDALLVEIDDVDSISAVGGVHQECYRPVNRIIGVYENEFFNNYSYLRNFDLHLWGQLLMTGQGGIGVISGANSSIYEIGWNSKFQYNDSFRWCIRITLKDGNFHFVRERGKVLRGNIKDMQKTCEQLNEAYKIASATNDPWCVSKSMYGIKSILRKQLGVQETLVECVSAEVFQWSQQISDMEDLYSHHYAPLFIPWNLHEEEAIVTGGYVFYMTNPLDFDKYLENWKEAGLILPEYELKIIHDDKEFDEYTEKILSSGLSIIFNPLFDSRKNLISGNKLKRMS